MVFRWCTLLCVLAVSLFVFGCSGGSSTDKPTQTSMDVPYKPGPADAAKIPAAGTYNGEYQDNTPDNWSWDMIYGQWYFLGSAEITFDGTNYYMHYTLSPEAIADGWGFCGAHVDIVSDPGDFPKNGAPGQFPWGWDWIPVYPDTPPTSYDLLLDGWTPPDDGLFYIAVHAVICKGSWVEDDSGNWNWVETANQTGWGGVWNAKSEDFDGEHWSGTWGKKWGGWYYTGDDDGRYPIWDDFEKEYYASHYGPVSYWGVHFTDNDPGSFYFDPAYWQENPWVGWCTDPRYYGPGTTVTVQMYSCYDPDLPDYAKSNNWDMISYMINQRHNPDSGGPFDGVDWSIQSNKDAFQYAVWYFKYGPTAPWSPQADDDYWYVTISDGSLADSFIQYAIANGDGYFPHPGEWYAAVMWPLDGYNGQRAHTPPGFQTNIVEIDP